MFPFIERIFADGGYAGQKMAKTVWRTGVWRLQIVKRSNSTGFEVLPKRWIVTVRTMLPNYTGARLAEICGLDADDVSLGETLTSLRRAVPAICATRRLPTQRNALHNCEFATHMTAWNDRHI